MVVAVLLRRPAWASPDDASTLERDSSRPILQSGHRDSLQHHLQQRGTRLPISSAVLTLVPDLRNGRPRAAIPSPSFRQACDQPPQASGTAATYTREPFAFARECLGVRHE